MSSLLLALCFALLLHRGNADTCNCNFLGYQSNTCGGTPTDNYNIAAGTTGVCTTFRWSGSIINNAGGYYKINSCGSSVSITVYSDSACATSTATKSWDAATCYNLTVTGAFGSYFQWQCGSNGAVGAPFSLAVLLGAVSVLAWAMS
eukprot:EG_transcript_28051